MENIDEKIEQTISSLNGIESAEPNPFFFTRLKARMENAQHAMPTQLKWIMKPSVIFGMLAIVLIMNVVSVMNYNKLSINESAKSNTIDGFATEYGLKSE